MHSGRPVCKLCLRVTAVVRRVHRTSFAMRCVRFPKGLYTADLASKVNSQSAAWFRGKQNVYPTDREGERAARTAPAQKSGLPARLAPTPPHTAPPCPTLPRGENHYLKVENPSRKN